MASESPTFDVFRTLGLSAASACVAEGTTLPLDTAKVRLQLQNRKSGPSAGPLATVHKIYSREGAAALWKGLEAGLHRQAIFTGLRIGLYGHIREYYSGGKSTENVSLGVRVATALTTSAIGITLANPSDVVKVRTQAASQPVASTSTVTAAHATPASAPRSGAQALACSSRSTAGQAGTSVRRITSSAARAPSGLYNGSALGVYKHIIQTEGVRSGLYSGYAPNLLRNSIISCSELVVYDTAKIEYQALGTPDGPGLHLLSGLTAGLVATLLGNPMDVVSTRIMVRKGMGDHTSMLQTCQAMLQKEGLFSFYQGFIPNFARIGSFNVVLWMTYEQLCALAR